MQQEDFYADQSRWKEKRKIKFANEKATQVYKLFSEGKEPLEVAIELNLRQKEVSKLL